MQSDGGIVIASYPYSPVFVFVYYFQTIYPIYLIAILEAVKLGSVWLYLISMYSQIRYAELKNFFLDNCRMKLVMGCVILLLCVYVLFLRK